MAKQSGLLISGKTASNESLKRIWGEQSSFRIFLSHKAEVKKETATLKEELQAFGLSSFVAHKDIHPTKEWLDEIEAALASMDCFVALLTEKFHESNWTDQEVGFAFARGVPIVAVRLGKDPYGFIGKFQGLAGDWKTCALELVKLLIKYELVFEGYVRALRKTIGWNTLNKLAEVMPAIEHLTDKQIDALVAAYNETEELRGAFAFNGNGHYSYGSGLVPQLNRLGARKFAFDGDGFIR